ncbi:hypothetical protein CQA53_11135 [Helicobacter didelphidarum]|uniref:Lipoprotein n=1 Tax=Helicobacter didelphidarum TaxID=2040648 RepID=A0A3D8I5Z5_9HELI|nr:hypothetical protein [Helicobacter didelphidarum]RDU59981.1 hypothetical protein CQA53_11135 [Helicobacter didelphidarum]
MKMSYSILSIIGILVAVVMFSGCGFRYFDPQYYEFKRLVEKESGVYVINEQIYDEWRYELSNSTLLSNGYTLYTDFSEEYTKIDSRILMEISHKKSYTDNLGKTHIISYDIAFNYLDYGIFLKGDEGRGFWWETKKEMGGAMELKKKYMEQTNDK